MRTIFREGGAMGALMLEVDWAGTPLGAVDGWPQSLRTAVSILCSTRFPMYIAWGPGYTQLYNDGYRPILGSTKHPRAMGSATPDTFQESWHVIGPMFDAVRGGQALGGEDWMLPLDRHGYLEECYFTYSYSPIHDEGGGVGGVLVTVTETTGRVLAERRLRVLHELSEQVATARTAAEACALSAAVLAGAPADLPFASLYLLDADGAAARLVGATVPGAATAPETVDARNAGGWPLFQAVREGAAVAVTDVAARFGVVPSGLWPESVTQAMVLPIARPGQDRPYGLLVAGVSPRRTLDRDYQEFLGLVAGHVATAITNATAYEEERLRAGKLAEVDRLKTDFFANVSHELRTPLTLLLAPAQDAVDSPDLSDGERARWAQVHRNALRLSRMVNALLDFSRSEAGRIRAEYVPTDLAAFTAQLAAMFEPAAERAGLTLSLDLPPLDAPVFVDRAMWEDIVLNLLSNAVKFTEAGGIGVSLGRVGDDAVLDVRDTGRGIPADELPHVFDRFHRVRDAWSRSHEGTGIGLALVRELAGHLGGAATVRSEPGVGTTFTVRVPFGAAHLPADRVFAPPVSPDSPDSPGAAPDSGRAHLFVEEATRWSDPLPPERPAATGTGRARVLLVEDNADMRAYLGGLFREHWDVEEAGDGEAGLRALRRARPDVVVADVMMPRLDGFGLLRAVREDPALQAVPVVLLSARAGEEATTEGLARGANDYVVKPFSARDLLARVAAQIAVAQVARRQKEEADRERARLYEHFRQAPFPIAALRGPDHVLELANTQVLRCWGRGPEIVGLPLRVALPELEGQPFLGQLDQVLRTGVEVEGRQVPARVRCGPGGALVDIWFNYVYSPLRDVDGRVDGVLVCAFDVTDQVVATHALAREKERLLVTLRSIADGVVATDIDGHVQLLNAVAEEITGVDAAAALGRPITEVLCLGADGAELVARTLRDGGSVPFGRRRLFVDARGRERLLDGSVAAIRGEAGEIQGAVLVVHDVTERQRLETEMERVGRLGSLGVLAGGIAHDFNNILAGILANVSLARRYALAAPKVLERLADAERAGVRARALTQQLLTFAKGGDPRREAAALAPLLQEAVPFALTGSRVRASLDLPADLWPVHADTGQVGQVIHNLVINARQAMVDGGAITVTARNISLRGDEGVPLPPGRYVAVAVADAGPGIPEPVLRQIFDPFFTTKPGGNGLGLTISHAIVHKHGGHLSVCSSVGRGTTFTVWLPVAHEAALPDLATPDGAGHARALVLDDEADVRSAAAEILDLIGFSVDVCASGEDAIRRFEDAASAGRPFDLVILDLTIPGGLGGREVIQRLRPRYTDMRAIVSSGYSDDPVMADPKRYGFDGVVTKPYTVDEMTDTVERTMRG